MKARFRFTAAWGLLAAALLALLPAPALAQDAAPCGDTVTIVEGDTLSAIAVRCDTTVDELLAANPGINPRALQIGSTVFIPGTDLQIDVPARAVGMPLTAAPGENVLILANGFTPGTELTILIGPAEGGAPSQQTAVANEQGALQATLLLPEDLPTGTAWQIAVEAPDGETRVIVPPQEPTAALWPTSGGPGTAIQVLANGFPPGAQVEIAGGPWQTQYNVLGNAAADDTGTVNAEVTLPALAALGEEWAFVVRVPQVGMDSTTDGGADSATGTDGDTQAGTGTDAGTEEQTDSGTGAGADTVTDQTGTGAEAGAGAQTGPEATTGLFDVTEQGAGLPPAEPTTGRAMIYLVALEDAGASGEAIGCGDSLVPVEVEVGQAASPAQAALTALLGIRTQTYGESGLYNALYQSDLAVESVNITDGTAVVNLTGTLLLGGACDAPRVEAQLARTVQQDPALTNVQITINGQPLESLLTQEG